MKAKANPWKDQVALYYLSIGVIEVDEKGQIWRLRDRQHGNHLTWNVIVPRRTERQYDNSYLRVRLWFNGKEYSLYSHRIVFLARKGLIPDDLEINHKNGIKTDNRPENLELMTVAENIRHGFEVLGRIALRGEHHNKAKLSEQEVFEIRDIYKNIKITLKELGKIYNISRPQIGKIVKRKSWTHI